MNSIFCPQGTIAVLMTSLALACSSRSNESNASPQGTAGASIGATAHGNGGASSSNSTRLSTSAGEVADNASGGNATGDASPTTISNRAGQGNGGAAVPISATGGQSGSPNPGAMGSAGSSSAAAHRSFRMGATPFFATAASFPDWRFENMDEIDLLSLHVDDFMGVPWDFCDADGCRDLPTEWLSQWERLATLARAQNKPLYLAVSPLGARRSLARRLLPDGALSEGFLPDSDVDSNGCYRFASAADSARHKVAYIAWLKYLVKLFQPTYLSPAIEINIPFSACPAQKTAWIDWYSDVHTALKQASPELTVFPTFQLEHLYGVADSVSACPSGTSYSTCFDQRLAEALAIPADRIAFSSYPITWKFTNAYSNSYPRDTFTKVRAATSRKIWISETGWAAVPMRASYAHKNGGSCGDFLYPDSVNVPGVGTLGIANDTESAAYASWLLSEAASQQMEAVIWWLHRDFLDGTAAAACPCAPASSDTCNMADLFYAGGGSTNEMVLRIFANMGLRQYDGSPRPAQAIWRDYFAKNYEP